VLQDHFRAQDEEDDFNPRLHVPSASKWTPPVTPHSALISRWHDSSAALLDSAFSKSLSALRPSNLTSAQRATFRQLRSRTDIIVKRADKNLGLAVLPSDTYLAHVDACLADTSSYRRTVDARPPPRISSLIHHSALSFSASFSVLDSSRAVLTTVRAQLGEYIAKHHSALLPQERKFLHASPDTFPVFYMIPKVHKRPYQMRPIVASNAWLTTHASILADEWLKPWLVDLESAASLPPRSFPIITSTFALVDRLEAFPEDLPLESARGWWMEEPPGRTVVLHDGLPQEGDGDLLLAGL